MITSAICYRLNSSKCNRKKPAVKALNLKKKQNQAGVLEPLEFNYSRTSVFSASQQYILNLCFTSNSHKWTLLGFDAFSKYNILNFIHGGKKVVIWKNKVFLHALKSAGISADKRL